MRLYKIGSPLHILHQGSIDRRPLPKAQFKVAHHKLSLNAPEDLKPKRLSKLEGGRHFLQELLKFIGYLSSYDMRSLVFFDNQIGETWGEL